MRIFTLVLLASLLQGLQTEATTQIPSKQDKQALSEAITYFLSTTEHRQLYGDGHSDQIHKAGSYFSMFLISKSGGAVSVSKVSQWEARVLAEKALSLSSSQGQPKDVIEDQGMARLLSPQQWKQQKERELKMPQLQQLQNMQQVQQH